MLLSLVMVLFEFMFRLPRGRLLRGRRFEFMFPLVLAFMLSPVMSAFAFILPDIFPFMFISPDMFIFPLMFEFMFRLRRGRRFEFLLPMFEFISPVMFPFISPPVFMFPCMSMFEFMFMSPVMFAFIPVFLLRVPRRRDARPPAGAKENCLVSPCTVVKVKRSPARRARKLMVTGNDPSVPSPKRIVTAV